MWPFVPNLPVALQNGWMSASQALAAEVEKELDVSFSNEEQHTVEGTAGGHQAKMITHESTWSQLTYPTEIYMHESQRSLKLARLPSATPIPTSCFVSHVRQMRLV
jgi:hypothetical protein